MEESEAKRRLEAAAACIGAALALATLGDHRLGRHDRWRTRRRWSPSRRSQSIRTTTDTCSEMLARNKGGATAAQVVVEGELRRGGESVETSQTTFDYVPRAIAARAAASSSPRTRATTR